MEWVKAWTVNQRVVSPIPLVLAWQMCEWKKKLVAIALVNNGDQYISWVRDPHVLPTVTMIYFEGEIIGA